MREAEVQQPKTQATPSESSSFVAFSEKVALEEAPSSTTATSFLPRTPPAALISSMARTSASRTEVSEIAMVPESEWRMPTLIVSPKTPSVPSAAAEAPSVPEPPEATCETALPLHPANAVAEAARPMSPTNERRLRFA